jgi:hypothetical protein
VTRTRYTRGNIVLLVLGTLLALVSSSAFIMGWGGKVTDFPSRCDAWFANVTFCMFPAFFVMYRWAGVGCLVLWAVSIVSMTLAFLANSSVDQSFWFPLMLISSIAGVIVFNSQEADAQSGA